MAANTYLIITDGTTTVTIADGAGGATDYRLAQGSWTPSVAGLRGSQLGGQSVYSDVVESFDLHISGSDVNTCLSNIRTLARLLEQAEQWYNNENVSPVYIKYSPAGSTTTNTTYQNQSIILGRAGSDQTNAVSLPMANEYVLGKSKVVAAVHVSFYRRGLWHLAVLEGAPSNSGTNGDLITLSGGTPLSLQKEFRFTYVTLSNVMLTNASAYTYSDLTLLLSGSATGLGIVDINSTSGLPATFTLVDDSANFSRTTNVLRYTPTATTEVSTTSYPTGLSSSATLIGIWANIRNNSATTIFQVRASLTQSFARRYTQTTTIQPSTGPRWYFLGAIGVYNANVNFGYHLTASAASGSLDTDAIVLADMSQEDFNQVTIIQPGAETGAFGGASTMQIDGGEYNRRSASVYDLPNQVPLSFGGNPYFATRAATLYAIVLQTGRDTTTPSWRAVQSGAVVSNTITANRLVSYLIPQ